MGLFGPPNIEKLKAKKDVKGLIKALRYQQEPLVRFSAAQALGQLGDSRAIEPLVAALEDAPVRQAAANALHKLNWQPHQDRVGATFWILCKQLDRCAQIGAPAVEPLMAALRDRDFSTRQAAAQALGEIGAPAVPALVAALTEKDEAVRTSVARALGQIGKPAIEPLLAALQRELALSLQMTHLQAVIAAIEILGQIGDAHAVEPLIVALKHSGLIVRMAAAVSLGQIGDARAVEPLVAALKDKEFKVRRAAASALGALGDAHAVKPLVALLTDKSMQEVAEQALIAIGEPATRPLIANLTDKDPDVCQAAAATLDHLGWQPDQSTYGATYCILRRQWDRCVQIGELAVLPLIAALQEKDASVRRAVARTLGQLGDARAIPPLIGALKDPAESVRQAAAQVLDELGWQSERGADEATRCIIQGKWDRCVQIGTPAIEPLIAALESKSRDVRQAAANTLGQIGDARAVEPLIAALKDKNMRRAAAAALVQIGAPAIEPLVTVLTSEKRDDLREAAAEVLDRLDWQPDKGASGAAYHILRRQWDRCIEIGTPAVEPLIAALGHTDLAARQAAAQALGRIGDARAVAPLVNALRKDTQLRQTAAESLGQIGPPAVQSVVAALRSKDENVRTVAARVLAQIGDNRATEALIAALHDQDRDVCRATVRALAQIGDTRAIEPLVAALKGADEFIRIAAAEALGQIGEPQAVPPLVAALKDTHPVRQAAILGLSQIGRPAVPPLVAALGSLDISMGQAAADALDRLGWQPDQGVDGAFYWIIQEQWDRCIQIGAPAIEPLIAVLKQVDRRASQAADTLDKLGWQPDQGTDGAYYRVVRQQWEQCVQIGASAVEPLSAVLPSTRAAEVLGQIGDARAVEPLIAALSAWGSHNRRAAARALIVLYQSGKLDEKHRRLVLAQRSSITESHADKKTHRDFSGSASDCDHSDYEHHDSGIGVSFPV